MKSLPSLALRSVLLLALLAPAAGAQTPRLEPAAAAAVEALSAEVGPVAARVSPVTGLVTWLTLPDSGYDLEKGLKVGAGASADARARAFLGRHDAAFGSPELELARPPQLDRLGMEHVRYRQTVDGVPVTAGELVVHLRGERVVAVHGETLALPDGLVTRPSRRADDVLAEARAAAAKAAGDDDFVLSEPRLEILHTGLLDDRPMVFGAAPRLAWFVEAKRIDLREYLWIDDETGGVLLQFSQLTDALQRQIFDAADGPVLPGALVRAEGGMASGDADVDAAYEFSGDTYDYFFDQHGRDSYDDAGAPLMSTVDYCPQELGEPDPVCPFSNAFWNGEQMVYGDTFSQADDVDAHELSHAVTEHTANLFYYMQSGALNESFSDIFGETVDLLNGAGDDSAGVRWLVGEELPGFGAIRDMESPGTFGDPERVGDPKFWCVAAVDSGGVHINSGVPNKAYSLMVDGGTFNSHTVSPLGLIKAGKIAYRVLSQYLVSGSGFHEAYDAYQQACADLVGSDGITQSDCTEVKDALDAVEMDMDWPCSNLQSDLPEACPAGLVRQAVSLFDDFESGGGKWTSQSLAGGHQWVVTTGYASDGEMLLYGQNIKTPSDTRVFRTSPISLPPDAYLHFHHAFSFETSSGVYWDGGIVEYSTNGGASWLNAAPLIEAGAAYNATLSSFNPLGAIAAYGGSSFGYTATRLDLGSLAGQGFQIGFRIGTDDFVDDIGWVIDGISIHRCLTEEIFSDGFESGSPSAWSNVVF